MAFDQQLASRIHEALGARPNVTEKAMFGGLAFLLGGKMFCGVQRDQLMLRVGPAQYDDALADVHARPMDFTGRPMKGYVFVAPEGCRTVKQVQAWIARALAFVTTLDVSAADPASPRGPLAAPRKRKR